MIVVDGQSQGPYEDASRPVFSSDSRRVAYSAQKNNKWFAVVDGKPEQSYDWLNGVPGLGTGPSAPLFSPDGQHVAYAASKGTDYFLVMDGKPREPYLVIGL